MLLQEVKERFYNNFQGSLLEKTLDETFTYTQEIAKTFTQQVLAVSSEEYINFLKSEHFHAMIVETYLESVLIIDATLNNTDLDKIVSYIYSNPVKNHPLVTLIQNKTVTLEGNPDLKDASGTIWVDSELNERLATAKGYLQRPALLESMKTLGDKNSTPKKIKI